MTSNFFAIKVLPQETQAFDDEGVESESSDEHDTGSKSSADDIPPTTMKVIDPTCNLICSLF